MKIWKQWIRNIIYILCKKGENNMSVNDEIDDQKEVG